MIIKLDDPKILTDVVSIISELVTEVRIRVDKQGLSIVAIDPANVALVAFKMPATAFSAYEAGEESIGVALDSLKNVLKRAGSGTSLIMQTEDNILKIELQDKVKRNFSLALINIEGEEKVMPMLEFSCKVDMNSPDFVEAVSDCAIIADSCSFIVRDGKFIVEARGLNSTKSEFAGEQAKVSGTAGKAKYSLEYLQKFIRACKLSPRTFINFSDNYPLKLEFKDTWELAFILAPRVESED